MPNRHPAPGLAKIPPPESSYLHNPSGAHVRIPRELMEPGHPLAPRGSEKYSKREATIDLYALAAWEDKDDRSTGEIPTGDQWLAERWGWSKGKVRLFIDRLVKTGTVSRWVGGPTEPTRLLILGYATIGRGARSTPENGPLNGPIKRTAQTGPSEAYSRNKKPRIADHSDGPRERTPERTHTKYLSTDSFEERLRSKPLRPGDTAQPNSSLPPDDGDDFRPPWDKKICAARRCNEPAEPGGDDCASCRMGFRLD